MDGINELEGEIMGDVVTTQQTGKGVKLSKFIAAVLVVIGVVVHQGPDPELAVIPYLAAVLTFLVASVIGWWRYS